MLTVLAAAILLAGCSGGSSSTAQSSAAGRATATGFDGAALPAGIEAPGFKLTDQRGRAVSLAGYRGLMAGKSIVIPGVSNKLIPWVVRLSPRGMVTRVVRRMQERVPPR